MRKRQVFNWVLVLLAALSLFWVWYSQKHDMRVATAYQVNEARIAQKLLIATQGSTYKDKVTSAITGRLTGKDVHVQVIDITALDSEHHRDFDAYLLIHTWEKWKVPKELEQFMKVANQQDRMFAISTSGSGDLVLEGVDGITSASILVDAEKDAAAALDWIYSNLQL